jgi:hypothetical protein
MSTATRIIRRPGGPPPGRGGLSGRRLILISGSPQLVVTDAKSPVESTSVFSPDTALPSKRLLLPGSPGRTISGRSRRWLWLATVWLSSRSPQTDSAARQRTRYARVGRGTDRPNGCVGNAREPDSGAVSVINADGISEHAPGCRRFPGAVRSSEGFRRAAARGRSPWKPSRASVCTAASRRSPPGELRRCSIASRPGSCQLHVLLLRHRAF